MKRNKLRFSYIPKLKKDGKPRKYKDAPSPKHSRMIELARMGGGLKQCNMGDIARIVSKESRLPKVISRQAVEQALRRWEVRFGQSIYDASRPSITTLNIAVSHKYASQLTAQHKRALSVAGVQRKRKYNKHYAKFRACCLSRSHDWKKGFSYKELAIKWGMPETHAQQFVCRARKRFPTLFPSRRPNYPKPKTN